MKLLFPILAALLSAAVVMSSTVAPADKVGAATEVPWQAEIDASNARTTNDEESVDELALEMKQAVQKFLKAKGIDYTIHSLQCAVPFLNTKRPSGFNEERSEWERIFGRPMDNEEQKKMRENTRQRRQTMGRKPTKSPFTLRFTFPATPSPFNPPFTPPSFSSSKKNPDGFGWNGYTWGNGKYNIAPWVDFGAGIYGAKFTMKF